MIDRQTQITLACELRDSITSKDWNKVKKVIDEIDNLKPYPYKRFGFLEQKEKDVMSMFYRVVIYLVVITMTMLTLVSCNKPVDDFNIEECYSIVSKRKYRYQDDTLQWVYVWLVNDSIVTQDYYGSVKEGEIVCN